jgi:hypothetical protein
MFKIFRKPAPITTDSRKFATDAAIARTLAWWATEGQSESLKMREADTEAWKMRQIPIAKF